MLIFVNGWRLLNRAYALLWIRLLEISVEGGGALIRTFFQWRLCTKQLSCWSALSLSRPTASPARDAALNFEGSSTPLCSLESCSCCHLRGMCDAICFPFCSVNARGLLYITLWACTSETIPVLVWSSVYVCILQAAERPVRPLKETLKLGRVLPVIRPNVQSREFYF